MTKYAGTLLNRGSKYIRLAVALLVGLLLAPVLGRISPSGDVDPASVIVGELGRLPLSFEPNAGQSDRTVLFTARAGESTFHFTRSAEVVISIAAPSSSSLPLAGGASTTQEAERGTGRSSSVRLSFVGADPEPQILPGTRLLGTVNYFLGNDPAKWQTNLPTYGGITYSALYPGIDVHYEGTQRNLKGTYKLEAGADPTAIRWRYTGTEKVSVDAQGNLQMQIRGATLTEHAPVAWQEINGERIPVQVGYALAADNSVGFELAAYDPKHELIIDPSLTYSSFLGGSSADYGYAIDVDDQGNAYVTGATGSTDFPVVNPIYPPSPNGDIFVTKINANATAIVYSTLIGGNSSDVGFGIAVDGTGSAYLTGETWSTNFPLVNPIQAQRGAYQSDAILLKVNPSGTALVFSTYFGGDGADTARDIAVDGDGSAYITGHTLSINFPLANPFQGSIHGIQDGFVTKFSPSAQALVFSTYLGGGSDIEYSNGIAIDSQRAVYVAGYTSSTDFPLYNPIQPTNHGFGDTFITKFNPPGTSLAYSTYLGGSDNDIQYSGLAVDPSGNAYVSGYTSSTDFPVVNAYQGTKNGFEDVFLTKINAPGTAWVYSTYLGGIFPDGNYHTGVAADSEGNAYVGGNTRSSDFPLVNNIQAGSIDSSYDDIFVTKFDPSGQELIYSTRLGGNNGGHFNNLDHLYGLALDAVGNVYITGETNSPQYPTTSGVFQPTKAANYDSFISRISAQGPNTPTPTATGTPPTATPTPCNTGANYTVTQQTGASIIPGTQDIGNHCDSCVTPYTLPFPVRLYDRTFTRALLGNNGTVGFVANQNFGTNQCLPATEPPMFNYAILPFWTEVRTDGYGITCPSGCGIFTSITGSAPNRTLHIEWRGSRFFNGNFGYVNFELRLFEGSPNFQVVYGNLFAGSENATIGAQKDTGSLYAQYSCDTGGIVPGMALTFSLPDCGPQSTPTTALTPVYTPTITRTRTPAPTNSPGTTNTPTGVASGTPTPLVSATSSRTATSIPTAEMTATTSSSTTPTPVNTSTATATACPVEFNDVPPGSTFYDFVHCLACRNVLNGYPDGNFRPNSPMTRGQLSKVVSNAAGFNDPHSNQTFEDVPVGSAFYVFIERLSTRGVVGGYACGGTGEPCSPENRPYFRPNANVTRGQTSKIVAMAAGLLDPPLGAQSFEDVPPSHTFYRWAERLALEGIVGGYACGGPGEPCDSESRPYFRPNANVTRGQASKIVSNTFFPGCATP